MQHIIVLYSGREGSSAIVSCLGKHSRLSLPIFEHMDFANVKQRFGPSVTNKVHVGVDNLLSGYTFNDEIFEERPSGGRSGKNVVFKWRLWGDLEEVSEVLKKHNVLIVSLARRDVVNHALSKYFTNRVLGEGKAFYHPQFDVKKLSEGERDRYIKTMQESMFSVDVDMYVKDLKEYVEAKKRLNQKVKWLADRGVKVRRVFYEDFLDDKRGVLESLLSEIGVDYEEGVEKSDFEKVNRSNLREQVTNIREVECDDRVKGLEGEYKSSFVT